MGIVWVEVGVGVAMVSTVASCPPFDGSFDCTCACESEEILERLSGVVRTVRPEAVIACCYACENYEDPEKWDKDKEGVYRGR